jgi:uncharacterized protein YndB with AHSA1/START domain
MLQALDEIGVGGEVLARSLAPVHVEVSVSVTIQADSRCVLHALTIPEYLEAWIEMPGVHRIACRAEDAAGTRFRFDLCDPVHVRSTIRGHCLESTPQRLKYAWTRSGVKSHSESLVDIRIKSCKRRCMVGLRHSGLSSAQDAMWYTTMWQRSLAKLCLLLER